MTGGSRDEIDTDRANLLNRLLDRHPLLPTGSKGRFALASLGAENLAWLLSESPESGQSPPIPRIAQALLHRRADLRRAFPDPKGTSREAFAYWFSTWGRAEYGLEWPLVRPVVRGLPTGKRLRARIWWLRHIVGQAWDRRMPSTPPSRPSPSKNLNLIGWTDSPTGVAQACRGSIAALEDAGVGHTITNLDDLPDLPSLRWASSQRPQCSMQIQLHHVNADMMDFVYRRIPYSANRSTYRIGYWFWELSQFPAELYWTYNFVDEVWSPSRFCYDSLSEYAPVEVRWVPPCVPSPVPRPGGRADLGLPLDSFLVFSSFDARSIALRKNPIGLVDAFAQLTSRASRAVHLLFNVVHPEVAPGLVELLREQTYQLPITLLTGGVSRIQYAAMLTACDAYVSLHRSEGLGLPMIEAMYLDKPVIATDYGGCLDFLDETTGWPVDYRISRIETSIGPYPAGAKWADPDIADATQKMLSVLENPEQTRSRCREARIKVNELYSARAAGERFLKELERLQALETMDGDTYSL